MNVMISSAIDIAKTEYRNCQESNFSLKEAYFISALATEVILGGVILNLPARPLIINTCATFLSLLLSNPHSCNCDSENTVLSIAQAVHGYFLFSQISKIVSSPLLHKLSLLQTLIPIAYTTTFAIINKNSNQYLPNAPDFSRFRKWSQAQDRSWSEKANFLYYAILGYGTKLYDELQAYNTSKTLVYSITALLTTVFVDSLCKSSFVRCSLEIGSLVTTIYLSKDERIEKNGYFVHAPSKNVMRNIAILVYGYCLGNQLKNIWSAPRLNTGSIIKLIVPFIATTLYPDGISQITRLPIKDSFPAEPSIPCDSDY